MSHRVRYGTVFLSALLFTSSITYGQAFGVNAGDPLAKHSGKRSSTENIYHYRIQVPLPNPEFEFYLALATPETGICKVTGIGRDHFDPYGSTIRTAYNRLSSALATRYGQPKEYDYIASGALWNEPREFVWSIYKKERTLVSYWLPTQGASLPTGIKGLALEVNAINTDETYLSLAYELSNYGRCKQIMDGADNQGL